MESVHDTLSDRFIEQPDVGLRCHRQKELPLGWWNDNITLVIETRTQTVIENVSPSGEAGEPFKDFHYVDIPVEVVVK